MNTQKPKTFAALNTFKASIDAHNKEIIESCDKLLKKIDDIKKSWDSPDHCIADVDSPCDCPKCLMYAATMEQDYKTGVLARLGDDFVAAVSGINPKAEKTARQRYESMVGMCTSCGEHTGVLDSCCGASVFVEGGYVNPLDAEQEVEDEEACA